MVQSKKCRLKFEQPCAMYYYKCLKTYQFKTHFKGDGHSSKTANIILPGLMIKQR